MCCVDVPWWFLFLQTVRWTLPSWWTEAGALGSAALRSRKTSWLRWPMPSTWVWLDRWWASSNTGSMTVFESCLCPICSGEFTYIMWWKNMIVGNLCYFWRDDPVTEISLKTFSNSRDVKTAIDKIVQKGGLSNVGEWPICQLKCLQNTSVKVKGGQLSQSVY